MKQDEIRQTKVSGEPDCQSDENGNGTNRTCQLRKMEDIEDEEIHREDEGEKDDETAKK